MDLVAELRTRLDLDSSPQVPNSRLQWCLEVAQGLIASEEPSDDAHPALLDESQLQLAIKVYDLGRRGTVSMDEAGEWQAPPPSATRGLIRSVQGILAPATKTGMTGGFA